MKLSRLFPPVKFNYIPEDCFVIMPFSSPYNEIYQDHIIPTLAKLKVKAKRADDIFSVKPVMNDIWESINQSRFLIAELTGRNANVFYKLGIAHTLDKPVILLSQSSEDIPFDVRSLRTIIYEYSPRGCKKLEQSLLETAHNLLLDLSSFTIGFAGSYREISGGLKEFVRKLVEEIIITGFRIVTGGGRGLSDDLHLGAKEAFATLGETVPASQLRTFKPVGYTEIPPPPLGKVFYVGIDWDECRKAWLQETDILIVIHGGAKTNMEVQLAKSLNIPIIVVGQSGGTAAAIVSDIALNNTLGQNIEVFELPDLASLEDQKTAALWAKNLLNTLHVFLAKA